LVDKTSINFEPGVTAIVGSNECSEFNVSDAIRLALAIAIGNTLRSTEMVDVTFDRTVNCRPIGNAEMLLALESVEQEHLNVARVEVTYDEVTITRQH
jgi:chromosome segregation protein